MILLFLIAFYAAWQGCCNLWYSMNRQSDNYYAKVIEDSLAHSGHRLTTIEARFPRFILAEFNTHRTFSRNSASSRAIPTLKMLKVVLTNPYVPLRFGANQKGMQAGGDLPMWRQVIGQGLWFFGRDMALITSSLLHLIGLHKQWANRPLEPYMWHTVIVTASTPYGWSNFFHQRCSEYAQPEMEMLAYRIREAYTHSTPTLLENNEWHLPYVTQEERDEYPISVLIKVSTSRCARVSYLQHDGTRSLQKDIDMHDKKLVKSGHWSPMEHIAEAMPFGMQSGNLFGFKQYRKTFEGECKYDEAWVLANRMVEVDDLPDF